jgi:FixJ family two-component response regulator
VLTDIVLVGMSGPRFAARVRAARPWLRVLFMSGYADDQALATATPAAAVPFIQKPFTADALARKVRAALDAPLDS